jgi:Protein of unknown function (DUF4031)
VFYVDRLQAHVRRSILLAGREAPRVSCHLATDGELSALHAFARGIGAGRFAFHPHARHPHYDLDEHARAAAIEQGAVEVTSKELVLRCFGPREPRK